MFPFGPGMLPVHKIFPQEVPLQYLVCPAGGYLGVFRVHRLHTRL